MTSFSRPGLVLVGLFAVLIVGALIVLRQSPINLTPPTSSSTQVDTNTDLTTLRASLPILAPNMPDFTGISQWWNTPNNQPLTPEAWRGKVVLVDFWTYSCINCIRTQPVLRAWWKAYEDDGLVIIGVHTPEFVFEKDPKNVEQAIKKASLLFPIALDADYGTWNAYSNRYWPAKYLFDRQGRLRYTHFGEGEYEQTEQVIRALLADGMNLTESETKADSSPDFARIGSPETYFGLERAENFVGKAVSTDKDGRTLFGTLSDVKLDEWTIQGLWKRQDELSLADAPQTRFRMKVQTNAMHLVLGSSSGAKRIRVRVDGKDPSNEMLTADVKRDANGAAILTVEQKDLYRIVRFADMNEHVVELEMLDGGVEFYAATFGE